MSRKLLSVAVLFVLASPVHSQDWAVSISSPSHGETLRDTPTFTSPFFDTAAEEILVSGAFSVPAGAANFNVVVNGQNVMLVANMGSVTTFTARVPAPNTASINSRRLFYPLTASILDTVTGEVLAVDRVLVYDARKDVLLLPQRTGRLTRALAARMTRDAIEDLEPVHQSSLPYGGLAGFNARLGVAAHHTDPVPLDNSFQGDLCLNVGDYQDVFTATSAYDAALSAARTQYAAFLVAKVLSNNPNPAIAGPATVAKNIACVDSIPAAGKFDACVGLLETELQELEVADIGSVDLALGPAKPGVLEVETELGAVSAGALGRLREVKIYWNENPNLCQGLVIQRPSAEVDEAEFVELAELADWANCNDLALDADGALSNVVDYEFDPDGSDPEMVEVTRTTVPAFTLVNPTVDGGTGTCSDPAVLAHFEASLFNQVSNVEQVIDNVWEFGIPPGHTTTLEALLSSLEIGTEEVSDHTLTLELETLTSFENIDTTPEIETGLTAFWDTEAAAVAPLIGSGAYLYSPQRDELRWGRGPGPNDLFGDPLEAFYAVTTGALNQVVGALSTTDRLWYEYEPTWAELGLEASAFGYSEKDPVLFTGDVLGALHPAFADLGQSLVRIFVRPTLTPFLWIHPDPPPTLNPPGNPLPPPRLGFAKLTYQLGQLEVDVIEETLGLSPPKYWFRGWLDLYDEEFQLTLGAAPGTPFLDAAYSGSQEVGLLPYLNEFSQCDLGAIGQPSSCGQALLQLVGGGAALLRLRVSGAAVLGRQRHRDPDPAVDPHRQGDSQAQPLAVGPEGDLLRRVSVAAALEGRG